MEVAADAVARGVDARDAVSASRRARVVDRKGLTMAVPRKRLPMYERPKVRADCEPGGWNEQRPCPFVACRHHLALDLKESSGDLTRSGRLIAPREGWSGDERGEVDTDMPTCSLDLAAEKRMTVKEIGALLGDGLSQQAAQQTFMRALRRLPAQIADYLLRKERLV